MAPACGGRVMNWTLVGTACLEDRAGQPLSFHASAFGRVLKCRRRRPTRLLPQPTILAHPQAEMDDILKNYVGRETPLYKAERLSANFKT